MHLGNLDPRMALNTNDTYIAGIPACTFVCPSACMDAWAVWMYGLYGSVDVWMYGWMMDVVGWMGGWMHAWLDGGMDGWMDGWMHGWMLCIYRNKTLRFARARKKRPGKSR